VHLTGCSVKGGARAGITLSASELCAFYSNVRSRLAQIDELSGIVLSCVVCSAVLLSLETNGVVFFFIFIY
jgi:hypothetical protein